MEIREVAVGALDVSLGRLRQIPESAVRDMAASLATKGQLSPVVAAERDGVLVLIDGFVRRLAAVRLGLASLWVEVVHLGPAEMKAQLYLRNRERGMALVEECRLVAELASTDGLNQVEIASLLERHKSWVCRRLSLWRSLSPHVVEDASLGWLSTGSLRRLAQLPERNQEEAVTVLLKEELRGQGASRFLDLYARCGDVEARRYLIAHPAEALRLAGVEAGDGPADPRLTDLGREVLRALRSLSETAARLSRRLSDGGGVLADEGARLLRQAHGQSEALIAVALGAVRGWVDRRSPLPDPQRPAGSATATATAVPPATPTPGGTP